MAIAPKGVETLLRRIELAVLVDVDEMVIAMIATGYTYLHNLR